MTTAAVENTEAPAATRQSFNTTVENSTILCQSNLTTAMWIVASPTRTNPAEWLLETAIDQGGATFEVYQGRYYRPATITIRPDRWDTCKVEVWYHANGRNWRYEVYGQEAGIRLIAKSFSREQLVDAVEWWLEDLAFEIDPPAEEAAPVVCPPYRPLVTGNWYSQPAAPADERFDFYALQ